MLTYTGGRNLFGTLTNNTTPSNLVLGDILIGEYTRQVIQKFPDIFTEQTFTNLQTYPMQPYYNVSSRLRKIGTVVINVGNSGTPTSSGGFNWPVKEAPSRDFWNQLYLTNSINSDIPQWWFFFNGQLGIYPRPALGYNPITITGQVAITTPSVPDYTTGTITTAPYQITLTAGTNIGDLSATLSSNWTLPTGTYEIKFSDGEKRLALLTNGATTVTWSFGLTGTSTSTVTVNSSNGGSIIVGNGTSWSTSQNGFYLNISVGSGGDNFWYWIDTVYDTTHLSLRTPYEGPAISSGTSTYTIGQASLLPEAYQLYPVYRSAQMYYTTISPDKDRADEFEGLAKENFEAMKADYGNRSTDPTVNDDYNIPVVNPNLTIGSTQSSLNQ